jgi:hypothetical protein
MAPTQCQALYILYMHNDSTPHYKTWLQKDGTWYECESFAYTNLNTTVCVKQLTPLDWQGLRTTRVPVSGGHFTEHGTCVVYCLVLRADAYKSNCTLIEYKRGSTLPAQPHQLEWVDGYTTQVHMNVVRRVPLLVEAPPVAATGTDVLSSTG